MKLYNRFLLLIVFSLLFINEETSYAQTDYSVAEYKLMLKDTKSDSARIIIYFALVDRISEEREWMKYNRLALNLVNKKIENLQGKEKKPYLRFKAEAISNEGYYYEDHGNTQKALEKYFEALKIYDEASFEEGKAGTLGNIGVIFLGQENFIEARGYFEKGLEIKKKYTPNKLAVSFINLGSVHDALNGPEGSIRYYRLALQAAKKVGDRKNTAAAYANIGKYYDKIKMYQESIDTTRKGMHLDVLEGNRLGESWSLTNIGDGHRSLGNLDSALIYLLLANNIAKELDYPELKSHVALHLYMTYSERKDWESALDQYKIHRLMQDSLYNVSSQKNALKQKMNYEHDLEKKTLSVKVDEERKRSRQTIIFISVGFCFVVIFTFIIFRRLRITRRQKRIIEEQKIEVETQKERSEELLLNILPEEIAKELKKKGSADAQFIEHVTVLFTDFKGFTALSELLSPQKLISELNVCFSAFDHIMEKHNIEKIKTIGDAYMAAGGLPTINKTHAIDVVEAAFDIQEFMNNLTEQKKENNEPFFEIRIGIHTGPVVAGIVGVKKFQYDI